MTIDLTPSGYPRDAWELLSPSLTEKRRSRLLSVAQQRSEHVRLVLQDVHDPHNISACLRSAEAFGVLNIDVVNLYQKFFKPSSASKGSYHWLRVGKHDSIDEYASNLKKSGYKIAAGFPNAKYQLDELPVDQPIAVVFGNEHRGVDSSWDKHIDYPFTIPMVGMVESLNISVSAALSMYGITQSAKRQLNPSSYYLKEPQINDLLCDWVCKQVRSYEKQLDILRQRD